MELAISVAATSANNCPNPIWRWTEQVLDFLIANLGSNTEAVGDCFVFLGAFVSSVPTIMLRSGLCAGKSSKIENLNPQRKIYLSMMYCKMHRHAARSLHLPDLAEDNTVVS